MGNDCSALREDDNPCQLAKCVRSAAPLANPSGLPYDLLDLNLAEGLRFKGAEIKGPVHLKLWSMASDDEARVVQRRMRYGLCVHKKLVNALAAKTGAPFFVSAYAGSRSCSFDDAVGLVKKAWPVLSTSDVTVRQHLARNLSYNLSAGLKLERPLLTDDLRAARSLASGPVELAMAREKMNFLVAEGCERTLADYLHDESATEEQVTCLLFQAMLACYALRLGGIYHGLLDPSAVGLDVRARPLIVEVKVRRAAEAPVTEYRFVTKRLVRLRNFERATADSLEPPLPLRLVPLDLRHDGYDWFGLLFAARSVSPPRFLERIDELLRLSATESRAGLLPVLEKKYAKQRGSGGLAPDSLLAILSMMPPLGAAIESVYDAYLADLERLIDDNYPPEGPARVVCKVTLDATEFPEGAAAAAAEAPAAAYAEGEFGEEY